MRCVAVRQAERSRTVPTILPPSKPRAAVKLVKQKQTLASLLFNGFMIVSALALTFIVLITEERYAFGPRLDNVAVGEQSARQKVP
jgi:hypothetical protein